MDVTPLIRAGQQVIQSYAGGKFRVSGAVYEAAIVVMPDEVLAWDAPAEFSDLKPEMFSLLAARAGELDVVLLGTGKAMKIPAADLRRALKDMGLKVEFMDTGAACRTYNVLMAEGRRVAAVLLPVL